MRLSEKVCIITGAMAGMGKAAVFLFAKEGAKIIVIDVGTKGGGEVMSLIK